MRVAYFVQSHRGPRQVERLLGALRRGSPEAPLVVGHCPNGEPLDAAVLDSLGATHFTHRRQCRRGYWSLLEPYFDAVELLAGAAIDYDWSTPAPSTGSMLAWRVAGSPIRTSVPLAGAGSPPQR